MPFRERILKYIFFLLLSFFVPVFITLLATAVLGDREGGLALGIEIGVLTLNFGFAFYFLREKVLVTLVAGLCVSIISIGLTLIVIYADIKIPSDFYGFWTALLTYGISSLLTWEAVYQFINRKNT